MNIEKEGGGVGASSTVRRTWTRAFASGVTAALVGAIGLVAAQPASAQVPVATANFNGFADGTSIHASALQSGSTTLAEVDQAYSGSAVNSQGFGSQIVSQINTVVQAAAADKKSGARGSGVELGIGATTPIANDPALLAQKAVATAPPNSGLIDNKLALNLDPIIDAALAEGKAQANWATDPAGNNGCVLGQDLALGVGHLAQAAAVGGPGPGAVITAPGDSLTKSREVFVPQVDTNGNSLNGGGVGLMSETTGTVAPVGLLGNAVTITVAGPWHLRAVATGIPGQAYMQYGPDNLPGGQAGTTPLITLQAGLATTIITAQQLVGGQGLNLNLGIAQITLATQPHALGGSTTSAPVAAADGTSVSGEVDILKVALPGIADVRLGHMEASATVPSGGILCQVDVSKVAQPSTVNPGDSFNYIISVHNPHACTLTGVKVVDTVTATRGILFSILGETPAADSHTSNTLTWNDIGPIAPNETKTLTVNMKIGAGSAGGVLTETANVTASCAIGNVSGNSTIAVPAAGSATIQAPNINGGAGRALPVTGGLTGRYYAVALLIGLGAVAFGRRGFKALFGSKA